jgi:AcrR family transcriptional regulator
VNRKQAILQAATLLFSRKGFSDTSMAEVSKMTGVAGGTIFYHFKNKEELFLAILTDVRQAITRKFEQFLTQSQFKTGLEMALGLVEWYLHLAGEMEDRFLLLHHYFPYRMSVENKDLRSQLESIYNALTDVFQKAVIKGQQDGSIRKVPAQKAALILFSMVDGVVRLKTYQLYDGGALYDELITACRLVLENPVARKAS